MDPLIRPSQPSPRLSPPTTEGGRYAPTVAARSAGNGASGGLSALSPVDSGDSGSAAPPKPTSAPRKVVIGLGLAVLVAALAVATSRTPSAPVTPPITVQPAAQVQVQVATHPAPAVQTQPVLDHVAFARDHGYRVAGQVEVESGTASNEGDSAMWGIAGCAVRYRTDGQRITGDGQGLEASTSFGAGTLIVQILRADSAATAVGLRVGDVLLSYDGIPMQSIEAVNGVHKAKRPLQPATITVLRGGATLTLTGPLGFGSRTGALQ